MLIPARNESATIGAVVSGCLRHLPRVLVVCDACTDDTAALARRAGAEVWEHPGRPGKAAALRWAWKRLGVDATWSHLVLLDGDGQHDPADLPLLLGAASADVLVVGSRAPFVAPMPWLRRIVNRFMSAVVSHVAGVRVADSQCGFRVLPRALVEQSAWTSRGFELESETILHAAGAGMRVRMVPVACRYGGDCRASHIRPWVDTWRWLVWLGRCGLPSHSVSRWVFGRQLELAMRRRFL